MKRSLALAAVCVTLTFAACGGGSGSPVAFVAPLNLTVQLDTVDSALGAGQFGMPIGFNLRAGSGAMGMVNSFFDFMNGLEIGSGQTTVSKSTDYGQLKIDFQSLANVTLDIDLDGQTDTVACSRKAEPPMCAYMWLDDQPFAFLVLTEAAATAEEGANVEASVKQEASSAYLSVGQGSLAFTPSMMGLRETETHVNATWSAEVAADLVSAYFSGNAAEGISASKARVFVSRDRSSESASLVLRESGNWSENPISPCSQSHSILGWQDSSAHISARFLSSSECSLPASQGPCVEVATAEETDDGNCGVDISQQTYLSLDFAESAAGLPENFPEAPTF